MSVKILKLVLLDNIINTYWPYYHDIKEQKGCTNMNDSLPNFIFNSWNKM